MNPVPPPPREPDGASSPQPGTQPFASSRAPAPQVIKVVARPGALAQAFGFVLSVFALGVVLVVGIVLGAGSVLVSQSSDAMLQQVVYRSGQTGARVAIIPVEGSIDEDLAVFVRAAVDVVLDDGSVKAVVLRVDSPGGEVTASDHIWYEVDRLRKGGVPVIASFGSVAASGGYYVSCGADHIVAERTTITGSIGVIAQILTIGPLLDKIGVEPVTLVARGSPRKDVANDLFRSWNEDDRAKVIDMLDAAYETFVARVKDGRLSAIGGESGLDAIADGTIFTAEEASRAGLVDSIGYLDDAVVTAEKLGRLPIGRGEVFRIERVEPFFGPGLLLASAGADRARGGLDSSRLRSIVNELSIPRTMYLMR